MSVKDWKRLFLQPPAQYSPAPMWFLNGDLQEDELARQLRDFAAKGVMGVILHPRIGVPRSLPYLSERFMTLIRFAVEECARLGMRAILYDEGMYPSGSANGLVVKENPDFAARGLTLVQGSVESEGKRRALACLCLKMTGEAAYEAGSARLVEQGEAPRVGETLFTLVVDDTHGTIRGIHDDQDDGQANAPAAADILNPEAVQCFLRLTHERYYETLREHFGGTVQAFFVDEPTPTGRCVPREVKPWTDGLEAMLPAAGLTLRDLPALWLDAGSETARIRRAFDDMISRRLGEVFYGPMQAWCHAHGVKLTGHPGKAGDIGLERYFDIPGQDVVWRWVAPENNLALEGDESTQALCAFSSALHRGKEQCSSECFGCCGKDGRQWTFSVEDMLFYLNWLMVRGTTVFYPHAFLYAADTPVRYGDRPPDVGPNNIWWPWYGRIARYITASSAVLSAGKPRIRVAILVSDAHLPWKFAAELFKRQIEFVYLEQSLLRDETQALDGKLCIAGQRYEVLAAEDETLLDNAAIADKLAMFERGGGTVLRLGDAKAADMQNAADALAKRGLQSVRLSGNAQDIRVLTRWQKDGCLVCVSNEGEADWQGEMALPAQGFCECLDPWNGTAAPQAVQDGKVHLTLHRREMLLFTVDATREAVPAAEEMPCPWREVPLTLAWQATWPEGSMQLDALCDWQSWPQMELYCGSVTYETCFRLDNAMPEAMLDLGVVRDLATVEVNDQVVDTLLKGPYVCDVARYLRAGDNCLKVQVTSCLASKYDHQPCPSGLLGPVRLLVR